MTQSPPASEINLLRDKEKSFLDKFLDWALTIGRFLIIVTETAALAVFVYRFSLDRSLVDLHDKIKQQQQIVTLLQKNESTYRSFQKRLSTTNALIKDIPPTTKIIQDIFTLCTANTILTQYSYNENSIHYEGKTNSITQLSTLITALKQDPRLESVSLDKVENKTSTGVLGISITVTIKKGDK